MCFAGRIFSGSTGQSALAAKRESHQAQWSAFKFSIHQFRFNFDDGKLNRWGEHKSMSTTLTASSASSAQGNWWAMTLAMNATKMQSTRTGGLTSPPGRSASLSDIHWTFYNFSIFSSNRSSCSYSVPIFWDFFQPMPKEHNIYSNLLLLKQLAQGNSRKHTQIALKSRKNKPNTDFPSL